MACFYPLQGFRARALNPSGKRGIVFNVADGYADLPVTLPCGRCLGCRIERSRQWAMRCMHEASLCELNSFVTLTYDDANLPTNRSVSVPELQKFIKRARKRLGKLRYYGVGEYGSRLARPHYHILLFGVDFPDKVRLPRGADKAELYRSPVLESLWKFGFSSIGAVSFDSAQYCAQYCTKKMLGDKAEEHYRFVDENGEVHQREPEFAIMSRAPSIGEMWYRKFKAEVDYNDSVVVKGREVKPAKLYNRLREEMEPRAYMLVKRERKREMLPRLWNCTLERLAVREEVTAARLALFKGELQ